MDEVTKEEIDRRKGCSMTSPITAQDLDEYAKQVKEDPLGTVDLCAALGEQMRASTGLTAFLTNISGLTKTDRSILGALFLGGMEAAIIIMEHKNAVESQGN